MKKEETIQSNYVQVGETIACGACQPDKFEHCDIVFKGTSIVCDCKCHKLTNESSIQQ